jgi:hypothetical protein
MGNIGLAHAGGEAGHAELTPEVAEDPASQAGRLVLGTRSIGHSSQCAAWRLVAGYVLITGICVGRD